ncbi:MAG: ATP-binding protein [Steroidobacteraceae bacterium]
MNVVERNHLYLKGIMESEGLFPHLDNAPRESFFNWDFGLSKLPREPGIIVIRGPRQYGKSTWLEYQLRETLQQFGAGSALFLNGDYIAGASELEREIESLVKTFPPSSSVQRLFIDEITAVEGWQKAVKRLADSGTLRKVLIITTGSKASDIQREAELLPGRKGKLSRTIYLFAHLPYRVFHGRAFPVLGARTLWAYLITGGSPPACAAVLESGSIPDYIFQTTTEWVYGESARAGRSRSTLLRMLEQLMRRAVSPVAQTTLAEESGMANNTVAHGYLDLLSDLLILGTCEPWDASRKTRQPRKASKYPFVNLLAANTWWTRRYTTPASLQLASGEERGIWTEWAVAAELYRRAAKSGNPTPLHSLFWRSDKHEVDFVRPAQPWIEVKAGRASAFEFDWFRRSFPRDRLLVINSDRFESDGVRGVTLEDFLLEEAP